MRDRLLGKKPDQIRESEKLRRLQDIGDRQIAHMNSEPPPTVEGSIEWMKKLITFDQEENELDRRYPSKP